MPPLQPASDRIREPRRRRSLISLTPLIDVVFILLVFFMLASSFLDWRSIDLSAPKKGGAGTAFSGALLVELRNDGLRLSGQDVTLDALARLVAERVAANPDQRVLLRPSQDVPLQDAVIVLDRLALTGVRDLSFLGARSK